MQEIFRQDIEIEVARTKCSRARHAALAARVEVGMQADHRSRWFILKHVCGGRLLSDVGRDANNNMYPVAFAVVEYENTESWKWFLGLLRDDLELRNDQEFTIISDQQKGLINAMKELLSRAEHRLCTRHLYNNFKKKFPQGTVKHYFWTAACASYPALFHKAMKLLLRISKKAYEELDRLDPNSWFMPLLTMIPDIHFKIMRRIRINREQMCSSDQVICPRFKAKLDAAVKLSRKWQATWDGESKYMVRYCTKSVTVNLDAKTCNCRAWELTCIPCPHVVAAIHDRRHQPLAYVSHYYTREMYLKTYSF
ncbi:uncharacterized protein LOC141703046 [Apium graveolens]|uniref:uncharacterized protein LOC141703046 n=1 Tax=Apium graveolens TaxID=4045 RepID=UPI003D79FEC6